MTDDSGAERRSFPQLTYDELAVAQQFESEPMLVRPDRIATHLAAIDDAHPWFTDESPFGGPIAPPTLVANQALLMRENHFTVGPGIHAKWEMELLAPIRPGMCVRSRGAVVDKYERRGRRYMVTEFVTEASDGTALVRGTFVQMLVEAEQ